MQSHYIYHLLSPSGWEIYQQQKEFSPESLNREGFIHCCNEEQITLIKENYFLYEPRIWVLKINTGKVLANIIEERAANNLIFPHIYGVLNKDAVEDILILK